MEGSVCTQDRTCPMSYHADVDADQTITMYVNRYSLHKVRCCSTHEITSDQVFMPALRLAFAQLWSQISFSSQLDS